MSTLSRRGFVAKATGALLIPVWGNRALGQTVDPRVAKVLTSTLAIDMHNHVYPAGTQQGGRGGDPGPAQAFVSRALTLQDLRTAHDRGQQAIVQTVEGAHFIEGRVERIEEVYKRGLRSLQLLHDNNDMVAPLGDINGGTSLGGLTAMGADTIKECNRLKTLVDMAHASTATYKRH